MVEKGGKTIFGLYLLLKKKEEEKAREDQEDQC